jgi:hypothetical protein
MKAKFHKYFISAAFLFLAIIVPTSFVHAANSYYVNVSGTKVHVPVVIEVAPIGATAKCKDGTYSFSQHHQGTCSHHRGVGKWL